jgi:hypothetical protein
VCGQKEDPEREIKLGKESAHKKPGGQDTGRRTISIVFRYMRDKMDERRSLRGERWAAEKKKKYWAEWHLSWPRETGEDRAVMATQAKGLWDRFLSMIKRAWWSRNEFEKFFKEICTGFEKAIQAELKMCHID